MIRKMYYSTQHTITNLIDHCMWPLHVTSHFGHFCIHWFGRRHQKCIAVIERKAVNVSLFTNAIDHSNKTCLDRSICACILQIWSFCWSSHLHWWTIIRLAPFSQTLQYISDSNMVEAKWTHMEVSKCDITVQWIYSLTCIFLNLGFVI